jgi:hypothetical protein
VRAPTRPSFGAVAGRVRPRLRLSLLAGVLAVLAQTAPSAGQAPEAITYEHVLPFQVAVFEWAHDLYDEAGLDLPPIDVVRHRSTDPCQGRPGFHWHQDGRSRIDLCTRESGPAQEFLILHELAHAWDAHLLTDARREAFLRFRGLTAWRDDDLGRWHELGAEQAAEFIAWGLIDRPVRLVRFGPVTCDELAEGFRILTGSEPLHGFTSACATGPV